MFKPFRGPLVTYTRIVPGSRLGPDLPRLVYYYSPIPTPFVYMPASALPRIHTSVHNEYTHLEHHRHRNLHSQCSFTPPFGHVGLRPYLSR